MSDRSPDRDPPRPDAVRRSLRALADGSASAAETPAEGTVGRHSTRPESVVRDAERAVRSARRAAAFLSAGRLRALDSAVAEAARRGDTDVASRGRTARESLRRLDAALNGSEVADHAADASTGRRGDDRKSSPSGSASNGRCSGAPEPASNGGCGADSDPGPVARGRDDHFHSGRGTVLRDTVQGPDR